MGRCSADLPGMIEHGLSAVQKWREVIGSQRSSDLSVAAFCRRYGIPVSSFYAGKRKVGRAPTAPAFIEAKVVDGCRRERHVYHYDQRGLPGAYDVVSVTATVVDAHTFTYTDGVHSRLER